MQTQARRQGGSVGSDEPPRLPNGPLEVFRKLLFWPLLTPQIAVTSGVEDCSIDNTVQVDTQRGNKRRGPRKCVETLTASGVGVLHEVVKLFLRF